MRLAFFFFPFSEFIAQFIHVLIHSPHIRFQIHRKDENRISVFQWLYSVNKILTNGKLILRGICYSFHVHVELGSFRVRTTWIELDEK